MRRWRTRTPLQVNSVHCECHWVDSSNGLACDRAKVLITADTHGSVPHALRLAESQAFMCAWPTNAVRLPLRSPAPSALAHGQ